MYHYCFSCAVSQFIQNLPSHQHPICPRCQQPLSYLGKESATLSPQDILDHYDKTHPFCSYFNLAKNTIYSRQHSTIDILQCEDQLKKKPDDLEALHFISNYYCHLRQFDKALMYFQRIIDIDSYFYDAHYGLAKILFYQKEYTDCVQILEQLIVLDPDHFQHHENLGVVYLHQQRHLDALPYFKHALSLCDQSGKAYSRLFDLTHSLERIIESG